jgi:hypothetical protein
MDTSEAIEQTGLCFHVVKCLLTKVRIFHPQANRDAHLTWRCASGLTTPGQAMALLKTTNSGFLFNIVAFRPNTLLFDSQPRDLNGFPVERSVRARRGGPRLGASRPMPWVTRRQA